MEKSSKSKKPFYIFTLTSGIIGMILSFVTFGLAVNDNPYSMYFLAGSLLLLGINRISLHVGEFKESATENLVLTIATFVLAILAALTNINIYFLITSMFLYGLTIIFSRILSVIRDHSTRSIIFSSLSITFTFLFTFIFFFPAIYEKHASSVTNWNFIVISYSLIAIICCIKNVLLPFEKKLKLDVFTRVLRKSMVYEILLSLLIIVILSSVYFLLVEEKITSFVDALWYSFSVITTIGFGDIYVTTTFGRILSVILGIAGIVVVALFTSIIVNIYNEASGKREDKKLNKIEKELEQLKQDVDKKE